MNTNAEAELQVQRPRKKKIRTNSKRFLSFESILSLSLDQFGSKSLSKFIDFLNHKIISCLESWKVWKAVAKRWTVSI